MCLPAERRVEACVDFVNLKVPAAACVGRVGGARNSRGGGDCKIATQAYQLLAKKAAGERKVDGAVFYLEQLNRILRDADPESVVAKGALEIIVVVLQGGVSMTKTL